MTSPHLTQSGEWPLHPPFGVGVNREQKIPQLIMQSPPPPNLVKGSQVYLMNSEGQYLENFLEASEFHYSHMQVDNPMSVTCGSLNTVKIVTPQNVCSYTNPTTKIGVINESLPSTKDSRGAMHTYRLE